ncbi:MAG: 2-C-methyl-D-erythritol 2,4-cyclodiphosphate synthase [Bacteroidetes bacterium]|nr:MAG: 2-C-methyl-D-erythritol 2,4-cyclodiphosphate synthase [Bacteroidota bacterium]
MVGFGYDSHKLVDGKPLLLGGIRIESDKGALAHSDGDVVLHSLCDSMLGASGLGDIGELFPDDDIQYKGADSSIFVSEILKMLHERSLIVNNVDITILLEKPKLKSYKESIRNNISKLIKIPVERINIKAKTNEGMGFIGKMEGIACYCICEIQKKASD